MAASIAASFNCGIDQLRFFADSAQVLSKAPVPQEVCELGWPPVVEDSSDEASSASTDVHEGLVLPFHATMAGDQGELAGFISQPSASVLVQDFALPSSERPPRLALEAVQYFALAQPGSSKLGITGVLLLALCPLAWHPGWKCCALCNGLFQEGDVEATREAEERPDVFGAP